MKKNYTYLLTLFFVWVVGSLNGQTCSETATASGVDNTNPTATVNSFPCTGGGTITAATLDATIGPNCIFGGGSWYYYNIVVNGVTVATAQCNQTGFNLSPYLPLTSVAIVAFDDPADGIGDFVTLNLTVNLTYALGSCPQPVMLNATNISSVSADISWMENGTATLWNVEYGLSGFTPGTGTTLSGLTAQNTNLSGLNGGTTYQFYVQSDCGGGDLSNWAGPYSFTTCSGNALCYTYSSGQIPTEYNLSVTPSSSSACPGAITVNVPAGFMITTIDVSYTMTAIAGAYMSEQQSLLYSPTLNTGEAALSSGVGFTGGTYPYNRTGLNFAEEATGSVVIELRAWRTWGGSGCNTTYNYVDNNSWQMTVHYAPIPTCPRPTAVQISNVTDVSAEINWTAGGTETMWNIEYGPTGFTPGTGTVINVTTPPPYTLTGLSSVTSYDVYIQADCGGGDLSNLTNVASFTTECGAFMAPFLESFSTGTLPNCWTNTSSNQVANGLWKFGIGADYGAASNGKPTGTYAWADGSTPVVADITLTSPLIDFSPLTLPSLRFELFSNNTDIPGDNCAFRAEVYNGTSWDTVFTYMGDAPTWQTFCIPLGDYVGQTTQVRFIVNQLTAGTAFYNDILLDEVAIVEGAINAGLDGFSQVCANETALDLTSVVTINDNTGEWFFTSNPFAIVNDTLFNASVVPAGTVQVFYIVDNICSQDTAIATVEIVNLPSAGNPMAGAVACNGQAAFLTDYLTGTINLGGVWSSTNANGQIIDNTFHPAGGQFGPVQFTYTVDNGICAPVSTTVTVNLVDCTGIDENDAANISLYPNPNNGQFFVMNGGNNMTVTVEVMDMQGKVVFSKQINLNNGSREEINVDAQSGMYLVRVTNETSSTVQQVIIK